MIQHPFDFVSHLIIRDYSRAIRDCDWSVADFLRKSYPELSPTFDLVLTSHLCDCGPCRVASGREA